MLSVDRRLDLLVLAADRYTLREHRAVVQLLSEVGFEELIAEPALGYYLAHAWLRLDNHEQAWELTCRLEEPLRKREFDRLYRLRLNLEGILLLSRNDLAGAESVFSQVHLRSVAAGDLTLAVHATLNLGAVTATRGDWEASLIALQRSLADAELYGSTEGVAACCQNLGIVCREMDQLDAADKHFARAYELYNSYGVDVELDLAGTEYERALVAAALGDTRRAEAMALRGLDRVVRVSTDAYPATRSRGEALRALGLVRTSQGLRAEAHSCFQEALECARATSSRLLEGEVCEAFSLLARESSDERAARLWGNRARSIFIELGAFPRALRVAIN